MEEENWSNGYREPVLGANHSTPPAEPARSVFMIWCVKGQIAWSNSRCATVLNWTIGLLPILLCSPGQLPQHSYVIFHENGVIGDQRGIFDLCLRNQ